MTICWGKRKEVTRNRGLSQGALMCFSSPEASVHLNEHLIRGYIHDLNTEPTKENRLQSLWISSIMHKSCPSVTGDKQGSSAAGSGLKLYLLSSTWVQSLTLWRSFPLLSSSQLRPSLHLVSTTQHKTNQVISLHYFPGATLDWLPANPRASENENMHTECSSCTLSFQLKMKHDWSSSTLMFCAWEPHLGSSLSCHFMGRELKITSHFGVTWITVTMSTEGFLHYSLTASEQLRSCF